jgi:hypothetical protein
MARAEAGLRIASFGNAENESYGIEYGYAYDESPVICAERGAEIPSDPSWAGWQKERRGQALAALF